MIDPNKKDKDKKTQEIIEEEKKYGPAHEKSYGFGDYGRGGQTQKDTPATQPGYAKGLAKQQQTGQYEQDKGFAEGMSDTVTGEEDTKRPRDEAGYGRGDYNQDD